MIGGRLASGALAAAGLALLLGAAAPPAEPGDRGFYSAEELAAILQHSPLRPLPPAPTDRVADSPAAARLGQRLFFDPALSAGGTIACATCHQPAHAFTDGRPVARGRALGIRNTPTLLDAAYSRWLFLDGRADSLWSQALQPLEDPREFGSDRLSIAHRVAADSTLRDAYREVFGALPPIADIGRFPPHARPGRGTPDALTRAWQTMAPADRTQVNRLFSNLGKAIEAYERRLIGGGSPFDRYVAGLRTGDPAKLAAVPAAAKRGLKLFVGAARCDRCHTGPRFSDGAFHNLGLPVLPGEKLDPGRAGGIVAVRADPFNAAGPFSDAPASDARRQLEVLPLPQSQLGAFKTPTLRNVALTAPYMHDGRFATLAEVMRFHAAGRAARPGRLVGAPDPALDLMPRLGAGQQADLIAFLDTLSAPPLPRLLTTPPPHP